MKCPNCGQEMNRTEIRSAEDPAPTVIHYCDCVARGERGAVSDKSLVRKEITDLETKELD